MKLSLVLSVAAIVSAMAVSAAPEPAAPGAGFEVERYSLSLTPDAAAKSVTGTETIIVRSLRDGLRSIVFSPNALVIDGATANGRSAPATSDESGVAIALPSPLARGRTVKIVLRYHGVPKRGVTATVGSMYTSYFACDWMICLQDSPGDKAWFDLDLRVPRAMTSLAAGRIVGQTRAQGGAVIHRWRSTRPVSAYLFSFAVGPFTRAGERGRGADLSYYGEGTTAPEMKQLFAETPGIVAFYSAKAGVPLPDGRYVQLLVPGREAQEAATYSLIGRGELEREAADPSSQWVIAHELAHQWWGNLVTCETWQDFWLNEGIATFMTAAWKEQRFGASAYRAELDSARARLGRAREAGWDRPLAFAGTYPNLGTRRAIQYSKGALFMDHLRTMLGEKAFWAGLRAYTRRHAGGTVTSIHLQRAMEQASGQDLGPVFREWVFG
ncbi:MAG TPA: M1 family metallopeptidase [Allosphingosinicella sp.]|nr:M1 family metallopeptidase [Allosphingosinicella sp.]